jgi:hypothetical protein
MAKSKSNSVMSDPYGARCPASSPPSPRPPARDHQANPKWSGAGRPAPDTTAANRPSRRPLARLRPTSPPPPLAPPPLTPCAASTRAAGPALAGRPSLASVRSSAVARRTPVAGSPAPVAPPSMPGRGPSRSPWPCRAAPARAPTGSDVKRPRRHHLGELGLRERAVAERGQQVQVLVVLHPLAQHLHPEALDGDVVRPADDRGLAGIPDGAVAVVAELVLRRPRVLRAVLIAYGGVVVELGRSPGTRSPSTASCGC